MRKRLRYLALLLVALVAAGMQAQTWTASAPAAGVFYLYNVGNAGFLVGGNNYTTRASLTAQGGIPVTLSASGTAGAYYISTEPTYTNTFLGSDGYVDKASSSSKYTAWLFTAVEGEENTYTIKATNSSAVYLVGHATDLGKTTVETAVPTTNKGYWKLVTKEALIANLANASEDNPMDATFAVMNAYFGANCKTSLWTGDYTAYNGVDGNKCIEQWNKTFDMNQTITGLPNGVYTMQCQGFYRMGGGNNDAAVAATARTNGTEALNAKYYINDTEGSLNSIFDYSLGSSYNTTYNSSTVFSVSGTSVYVPNSLNRASSCFLAGEYLCEPIKAVVTDGTVKLGFRKTVASGNDWAAYDNVTLTYYGIDLSALVESYDSQLAAAKALQSAAMQATVKSTLSAAITAAETDVNTSSQEWLEATLSTLSTAIAAAQTSNALYTGAILNAVNGMKAQSTIESVKEAIQAKYDEGEYASAADVYATYQPLEIAALGTEAGTSYTSAIINPSFELGNTDGWTIATPGADTGAKSATSDTYLYSGTEGDYLFNTWTKSIATLDIAQTITGLPLGYYTLSATVASFGDGAAVTMVANGSSACVNPTATDVDAEKKVGYALTVEDVFVTNGTLTFKVSNTGKGETLLKADAFKLTFVKAYEPLETYTDLTLTASLENTEVARYLANTTYTTETAAVITNYATDASLRNDQPAAVQVPVPAQTVDATLSVSLSSDYTTAWTFTVAAGSIVYDVVNLVPQQTYYYKVEADGSVVANGTIATTGQLRMMKADGIANMRDLGGWTNADGNRIRYGKIFRGSELRGGKSYTASDADLLMLKDELGIGAEVDLREDVDFQSGTMSSSAIDGATYYYANLNRWSEDALNYDVAKFKSAFDLVLAALKADKAAYFHCIFGADRTGCFAFLLEGLLGLPVDQLYKDYELTSFSSAGLRAKDGLDHKVQYISALQGETLQEKFYNYWRGAVGVSESDLNDFINIMIDGESPITTATLADLPAKAVEDGEYYIYLPEQEKFLGRGEAYGARALADNYGVPVQLTTNGANVTTFKYLDSDLYLGSDCFTDKAAYYNTASWFIEQRGTDLVLRSHNGFYVGVTTEADGLIKPRANVATQTDATPFAFKTAAEQKAIVAATQQANVLAAAAAAGIEATDLSTFNSELSTNYTAVAFTATIKSAKAGSTTDWPLTQPSLITSTTANFGNAYNVGTYGGELYQRHGYVSQTVNVPHAGLYKLTLNALYREGSNANCYALGQKGYELSNAYVSVNDTYFAQIPSWYSGSVAEGNPNTTDQAVARFNAGEYKVEVYAYIGEEKKATIAINVPGFTPWGWCLFNSFALTEYAKNVTLDEASDAAPEACTFANVTLKRSINEGFNTLCLPFSLTATQLQTAFGTGAKVYTLTDEAEVSEDYYKLIFTEGTALAANTPAIVSGVSAEKAGDSYTFTGIALEPASAPTSSTDHFDFIGTFAPTTVPAGDFFLRKGTDEIVRSVGNSMKGFRAYFAPKTADGVKSFSLSFADADGIDLVNNGEIINGHNVKCYDLSGREIVNSKLNKGVYIIGGRKIAVK